MGYVEEACIVALLSAYIHLTYAQQAAAYKVSVMVPSFTENASVTVVCKVNNSELNDVNCPSSVLPITSLRIILSSDPPSKPLLIGTELCDFSSFLTCTRGPPVSALECGCYHDGGDIYTVNVTVRADRAVHENKTIDCRPDCITTNVQYALVNTVTGIPIVFESRTTTTTITTRGSTTLTPSYVSSSSVTNITITSGATVHSSSGTTVHSSSAPPCKVNCPQSAKCPDWCIAVSVCVPVGGGLIIIITVIIIKKKKSKTPGSRPTPPPDGNNRTEVPTINTKAEVGNNWTELTTTTAPGGNNRTELNPEKEKRRKKKKKKKTFQEVDGEPVSREEKSTINDHKAAQNDNSVSVDESSHAIDNGGHRSLPMPKIPHLTPVERNSTIVKSETPRKLPPLQLKQ